MPGYVGRSVLARWRSNKAGTASVCRAVTGTLETCRHRDRYGLQRIAEALTQLLTASEYRVEPSAR
jgi:hypothetical protein